MDFEDAKKVAAELGIELEEGVVARRMGVACFLRRYWVTLLGTALSWFIMDIAFYGTGIYSAVIVRGILGVPSSITQELFEAGLPYVVGAPGYFLAVVLLDRVGRKALQVAGFLGMASIYLSVSSLVLGGLASPALSMAIYSLSFLTINAGPNTTTFVLPSEVFPVRYRSTGHGISAAAGKAGAGLATLWLIPELTGTLGVGATLEVLAALSAAGAALTLLLKEPARRTLEEASREEVVHLPEVAPLAGDSYQMIYSERCGGDVRDAVREGRDGA
ncbi:MAG: MFS transporter [Conexivisphaera sp.]